jgi:catalase (peroxidase I)
MEKHVTEAAAALANNDQTVAGAAKCPVAHGARGRRNRDWWPDALDISVLHRNSSLSIHCVVKVSSHSGVKLEQTAQAIATVNGPALRRYVH